MTGMGLQPRADLLLPLAPPLLPVAYAGLPAAASTSTTAPVTWVVVELFFTFKLSNAELTRRNVLACSNCQDVRLHCDLIGHVRDNQRNHTYKEQPLEHMQSVYLVGRLPCTVSFPDFWCMSKVMKAQQGMNTALTHAATTTQTTTILRYCAYLDATLPRDGCANAVIIAAFLLTGVFRTLKWLLHNAGNIGLHYRVQQRHRRQMPEAGDIQHARRTHQSCSCSFWRGLCPQLDQ